MSENEVKQQVRQFYDRVGWQVEGDGFYQNARYEDLRPVSQAYIHRCHMRVTPFLQPGGRFILDAGSGPVQYREYLTYSENYERRVCADISIVALKEARRRLGDHGMYVVCDVARLPFRREAFEGVVSLHTLHHLPLADQKSAYGELHRVLATGRCGVVVNGWTDSPLMRHSRWLVNLMERAGRMVKRLRGGKAREDQAAANPTKSPDNPLKPGPTGTFVQKLDAEWLRKEVGSQMSLEIRSWRSVNVRFLRAVIHEALGGRLWLKLLFALEERFPGYFGERGQYPLIVIRK